MKDLQECSYNKKRKQENYSLRTLKYAFTEIQTKK